MFICHKAVDLDQPVERLDHEFLTVTRKVEYLAADNEIASVNPNVGLLPRSKPPHRVGTVELGKMKGKGWTDGHEAGDLSTPLEALDHLWQRRVCQPVAVI